MSVAELRKAAETLRELAEGLASQAKWERASTDDGSLVNIFPADSDSALLTTDVDTAAYIAALHPGVGLALADWLDLTARRLDEGLGLPGDYAKPLTLARLINGGAS